MKRKKNIFDSIGGILIKATKCIPMSQSYKFYQTLKEKYVLKFISEASKMSIYQLPDELILKVLSYLEIKDFLSCGQGGVHVL